MSLIQTIHSGEQPNWLASAECIRVKTATAPQSMGVKDDDTMNIIVKSGTIYPANDATAQGIIYQDVNVTKGDYPCSLMTSGYVYADRLPEAPTEEAKTALAALGIRFETAPEFERSY